MFDIQESTDSTVVNITEERLDMSVAQKMLNDMQLIVEKPGKNIILNLKIVNYMDSSVLGALVQFQKKLKDAGKSLIVTGLSPSIQKIFVLTKLDRFFTIK